MSYVGALSDRKDRPAYVRFERRAVEDRSVQTENGAWPHKDVDYALVTPPYSRDCHEQVAAEWLSQMRVEVQNGRLPEEWYDNYVKAYERWKKGEEIPLNGTPIKGWGVISPAQQKNLIALNVLTVEDLAGVNDEGCRRIGMGAIDLRNKAKAWLSQLNDKGPLTQENAALKADNQVLKERADLLEARVKELAERLEILQRGGLERGTHFERAEPQGITAADLMDEPEPEAPRRRKARPAAETAPQI